MRVFGFACVCAVLAFLCVFEAGTDFGNSYLGPLWGLLALALFVAAFGLMIWGLASALLRTLRDQRRDVRLK